MVGRNANQPHKTNGPHPAGERYTYPYPRPALTVDVAVFAAVPQGSGRVPSLRVLLIRRDRAPFVGRWALPGGFVDADEDLPDAARRELLEETGLRTDLGPQLGTYGTPGRDPRGHTVSVVYLAWRDGALAAVRGLDDAADARWHDARQPLPLAFDHHVVLRDAVARLASMVAADDDTKGRIGTGFVALLPTTFGSDAAIALCAAAAGRAPSTAFRAAVRRALRRSGAVREIAPTGRQARFQKRRR